MERQLAVTMQHIAVERMPLPRTSEAIVASELRSAIMRGDLAPGAKIRQEATAQELGVSLIPVREALKTLAGEGAVTYRPQRGYFVSELPNEAIAQIYAVRSLLEAETERSAVPRVGEHEIAAMRTHLRVQERAAEDHDAVEMIAANRALHFTIFHRCENPWLVRFVTQLWDAVDPYRVLSYRRMWIEADEQLVPAEILSEHDGIIKALERHKPDRALRLLEQHRERSRTFLTVLLDSDEPPG
jgi:DNA-binding GntR family transcriptional regulator